MATVANKQIRDAAKEAGICLWQVAEKLGVNDGNFSRSSGVNCHPQSVRRC